MRISEETQVGREELFVLVGLPHTLTSGASAEWSVVNETRLVGEDAGVRIFHISEDDRQKSFDDAERSDEGNLSSDSFVRMKRI